MKFALLASLLLTASAVQASSYNCFSHEEMGPVHTMTIAAARMTSDMNGRQFSARTVVVKEGNTVIMHADGVGSVTAKKIALTLLEGGDMAMGSVTMNKTMPGRLSGKVTVLGSDSLVIDMSCVTKK